MDYFKLARAVVRHDAQERYGVTIHDPYACDMDECRLCREFHLDEKIDRTTDSRRDDA